MAMIELQLDLDKHCAGQARLLSGIAQVDTVLFDTTWFCVGESHLTQEVLKPASRWTHVQGLASISVLYALCLFPLVFPAVPL
jgi:hypothetical protein